MATEADEDNLEDTDDDDDEQYDCICVISGHGGYIRESGVVRTGEMTFGKVYVINAVSPGCSLFSTKKKDDDFIKKLKLQAQVPSTIKNLQKKLKKINMFKIEDAEVDEESLVNFEKLKNYTARYLPSNFLDTFLDKQYSSDMHSIHKCVLISTNGAEDITIEGTPLKSTYLQKLDERRFKKIAFIDITCNQGEEEELLRACVQGNSCGGKKNRKLKGKTKHKTKRRLTRKTKIKKIIL